MLQVRCPCGKQYLLVDLLLLERWYLVLAKSLLLEHLLLYTHPDFIFMLLYGHNSV